MDRRRAFSLIFAYRQFSPDASVTTILVDVYHPDAFLLAFCQTSARQDPCLLH